MSSPYTVQQLVDRALRQADMFGSNYISPQEQLDLLNESYTEWYDVVTVSYEEYFIIDNVFLDLVPGQYNYDLPDDFYKGVGVDFQINLSATSYITLKPFTEMERNGLTGIIGAIPYGRVKLRYIPQPVIYTDSTQPVDTKIAGWDTLLVTLMAIAMRSKEESSTADLERKLARQLERIQDMSQNRDTGFPHRVNDVNRVDVYQQFATLRYQYSGDFIRFLPTTMLGVAYSGISG